MGVVRCRGWLGWVGLWLFVAPWSRAAEWPDGIFAELELRHVGPAGNRVSAVVGVPGEQVYLAGAASGGIFRTDDGGVSWTPVFDEMPAASIGALAVAPSDPNVVWAGTGEAFLRSNVSIGNGVYRSTDGGRSWAHAGLDASGRIGRIVVDPRDPDVVLVAALGHAYGPQPERGVYKTTDGGASWRQVLFVDEATGAVDLALDPTNPRIVFATTWQIEMTTWGRTSGGPGSGLWTSRDGGESFTRLEGNGLPPAPWGKVGVALSGADPRRIYALIETSSNRDFAPSDPFAGTLWRSDDGGRSWRVVNRSNALTQRPLYYTRAVVAPDDADEVHFMAVRHGRSKNGGEHVERVASGYDHHDLWIDPEDPSRMIVGHDGGVSISTNRGRTWFRPQLPIAQMYHVHVDDRIPYYLYGNRQDGLAVRGPSRSLAGGSIPLGAWRSVGGCEVGMAIPVPGTELVWSGCYDGILELHDLATGHSRDVSVWPLAIEGWAAEDLRYRFQWSFPLALSPHDPERVYAGTQHVHRTTDRGRSWIEISPDLTFDDPAWQRRSGGLTFDDAGPTIAPVVFAIAESPLTEGLIWAGTNDGRIQLTRDGGGAWNDVTANLPDLPPDGTVSNIEPSRHAAGAAYVTIDRHQLGDFAPYVYRTADYGASWRRITAGLPVDVFGNARCVREDPVRPGLLFLGTENGLHVSFDDGEGWLPLKSNLPPAPVAWLTVQERFADLVVATYGRGFWILDDLTPLRALAEIGDPALDVPRLLEPRPAYRFRRVEPAVAQPGDPAAGSDPPYGASLHYLVPEGWNGKLELRIRDAEGGLVRTLGANPSPGLHRVWWDLRGERTPRVELRTSPDERPDIGLGENGWRRLADGGRISLLAPAGRYQVELEAGEEVSSATLEVLPDPRSTATAADLEAQGEALAELRQLVVESVEVINGIEWLRRQLEDLRERLSALSPEAGAEVDVAAEIDALEGALKEIEGRFFDLRLTDAGQDTLRWPRLLYARLTYLARRIGGSDHRPTTQQLEVLELLRGRVETTKADYARVVAEDLAAFNEDLATAGLAGVIVARPTDGP